MTSYQPEDLGGFMIQVSKYMGVVETPRDTEALEEIKKHEEEAPSTF